MPRGWRLYGAFAGLALLLGPVTACVVPPANDVLASHALAAESFASLTAGVALRLAARPTRRVANVIRKGRIQAAHTAESTSAWTKQARRALWLLLLPQIIATIAASQFLPAIPRRPLASGDLVAFAVAAPLWLALLAATQQTRAEVPRQTVGAAIAGVAALLLVLATSAFEIQLSQLPMLFLDLSLAVLTVFAWSYAAEHLNRIATVSSAARFLILRGLVDTLLSVTLERTSLHGVSWRDALVPLAFDAMLAAIALPVWFYLLKRMNLAAFTLHPLAIWTASLLAGIAIFGITRWRMDLAAAIAVVALILGLRARAAEEEPTELRLA